MINGQLSFSFNTPSPSMSSSQASPIPSSSKSSWLGFAVLSQLSTYVELDENGKPIKDNKKKEG